MFVAGPALAADPVIVELPIDGPLTPAATDSVGLGVHPRDPDSFRSLATERLVKAFVELSVPFDVEDDGTVGNELHGVISPAGIPAVRFVVGRAPSAAIRLGADETGGAAVAMAGGSGSLVGVARRPGIVTVDDVVATVLGSVGIDRGDPMTVEAPVSLVSLRARLERDVGVGVGLSATTVVVAFGLLVLAALARARQMFVLSERLAVVALWAPVGYLLGLFIPSGSWFVRSIPVLLTPLAVTLPRVSVKLATAGLAAVIALLTVWAALNPSGEPALSLWGNPFESVRFFGLRNHLEAFIAGGLIMYLAIGRATLRSVAAIGIAAAVLIGAPWLGANFGGVLTLTFGVAIVWLVRRGWRSDARMLAFAALMAVVGMVLALLSDTGTPISHGGRAVRSVSDEGPRAIVDILRNRARLNWQEVTDLRFIGYLGAAIVVASLLFLLVQGMRALRVDGRASTRGLAVFAGTCAALLAVITEDSGFMTGGILALYPAASWLMGPSSDVDDPLAEAGAALT